MKQWYYADVRFRMAKRHHTFAVFYWVSWFCCRLDFSKKTIYVHNDWWPLFVSFISTEHYHITSHESDLVNIKVLCREDKVIPRKVREGIFIKTETSLILNRGRGCELSKIYDSLPETPSSSSRTPPKASSGRGSVSRKLATIRWGWRRVSPKYSVQKRECCWTVLNYFWFISTVCVGLSCSDQFGIDSVQFSSIQFISIKNTKSNNIKIIKNHKHRKEEMQRKAKAWYLLHPLKEQKQLKTIQDKTRRYKTSAEVRKPDIRKKNTK